MKVKGHLILAGVGAIFPDAFPGSSFPAGQAFPGIFRCRLPVLGPAFCQAFFFFAFRFRVWCGAIFLQVAGFGPFLLVSCLAFSCLAENIALACPRCLLFLHGYGSCRIHTASGYRPCCQQGQKQPPENLSYLIFHVHAPFLNHFTGTGSALRGQKGPRRVWPAKTGLPEVYSYVFSYYILTDAPAQGISSIF